MDYRDLKYFEVIAQEGHVGRAAEKLFRTQPALSKCIDRLEESLGVKLFEKDGRGIRLTPAGKVLLSRTQQIGVIFDDTAREISDYASGVKGHTRLGCLPTLAEHLLPNIFQQLLMEARDVTVQLVVSMNDVLLNALNDGDLDLIVGPIIESGEAFESEEIIQDEVVVLASKNHEIFDKPYGLKDLLNYRWVLPATTVASRRWLDQTFDRHHLPRPQVQIEPTVLNMLLPIIEKTSLLRFATKANLQSGKMQLREVKLKETTMRRRLGITYRKNAYLSPATQHLMALLRTHGKNLPMD
jgi:DNA-binding transcriptional LysR family regulator